MASDSNSRSGRDADDVGQRALAVDAGEQVALRRRRAAALRGSRRGRAAPSARGRSRAARPSGTRTRRPRSAGAADRARPRGGRRGRRRRAAQAHAVLALRQAVARLREELLGERPRRFWGWGGPTTSVTGGDDGGSTRTAPRRCSENRRWKKKKSVACIASISSSSVWPASMPLTSFSSREPGRGTLDQVLAHELQRAGAAGERAAELAPTPASRKATLARCGAAAPSP